ncbi:unnamed protein product, partial [Effrenium voratum]
EHDHGQRDLRGRADVPLLRWVAGAFQPGESHRRPGVGGRVPDTQLQRLHHRGRPRLAKCSAAHGGDGRGAFGARLQQYAGLRPAGRQREPHHGGPPIWPGVRARVA